MVIADVAKNRGARIGEAVVLLRESRRLTQSEASELLGYNIRPFEEGKVCNLDRIKDLLRRFMVHDSTEVDSVVAAMGAVEAFSNVTYKGSHENNKVWRPWHLTLYRPMRRLYASNGLNSSGTLIVGSGYGEEVSADFGGTLLDVNINGLEHSAMRRPNASAVNADAAHLPFADGSYDNVVISLLLSQLHAGFEPYRKLVYEEAKRVAARRLIIVDTVAAEECKYGETGRRGIREFSIIDLQAIIGGADFGLLSQFKWIAIPEEWDMGINRNFTVHALEVILDKKD